MRYNSLLPVSEEVVLGSGGQLVQLTPPFGPESGLSSPDLLEHRPPSPHTGLGPGSAHPCCSQAFPLAGWRSTRQTQVGHTLDQR